MDLTFGQKPAGEAQDSAPRCTKPPDDAVQDGDHWKQPDGTVLTGYCTPAELEADRRAGREILSLLAFIAACVLAALSWLAFKEAESQAAWMPELLSALLVLVPLGLGVARTWAVIGWVGLLGVLRIQKHLLAREWAENDRPEREYFRGSKRLPVAIRRLQSVDVRFSRVAFLDFATALYHALYTWPGTPREPALGVFVTPAARESARQDGRVDQVVVGAVTLTGIQLGQKRQVLTVEFDANYTRHPDGNAPVRVVSQESWTFERDFTARSPEPARLRVLTCPFCGAPVHFTDAGVCAHCQGTVKAGFESWAVTSISVKVRKQFDTTGLGETVPERGTLNDTLVDPELGKTGRLVAQGKFEPFFASFDRDIVRPTFSTLYAAWSSLKWEEVRHLLGDRLWESQAFWMAQYREKGLANRLEKLEVQRVEPVRAEQDQDVEALTVRIFASGLDYTVDGQGQVVGGDPHNPRAFSEYWVFVRSRGAKERGAGHVAPTCPNCGAPLDRMSAAGICGYCEAKVTCGDHGWVLTQIIQDESYEG